MKARLVRDAAIGAIAYPMIEICYRGRTHASMALAGAAGLCSLRLIKAVPVRLGYQALLGGASLTAIELAIGLAFNRNHKIWDYRDMPAQLRGQICLPYSIIWCGISLAALSLMRGNR